MNNKFFAGVMALLAVIGMAGCGGSGTSSETPAASPSEQASAASGDTSAAAAPTSQSSEAANDFDSARMINVVSREDGSGTREAFIELFGIQEKKEDGSKVDNTTKEATIAKATDVMMATVSGDEYAIGYISLGSMNDSVKALEIDGAAATAENVKSGAYKIARPFNIATKGEPTGLAKDFIGFIMSAEGQQVVEDSGYIKMDDSAEPFAGDKPEGKIVVAGSSSVTPVMEKLAEAYQALNTGATIEIQQSDSTAGMTAAMDGTCDIGMASRKLKDSETEALKGLAIANDGIAVVVSPGNPLTGMTSANIKDIYTGAVTIWDAVR